MAIVRCIRLVLSLSVVFVNNVPCMLENPICSMIWKAIPLMTLCKSSRHLSVTLDQCQFGARWRKRTRVSSWGCGDLSALDKRCSGHKGLCSRTNKYHIVLTGRSPAGPLWTSLAQTYPRRHSYSLAGILIDNFLTNYNSNWSIYAACGHVQ